MTTTTIDGRTVHVNDEGFLTDPSEWDEQLESWRNFVSQHQRVACHADTSSSFLAALLSGFGIGLCPDFYRFVQPELVPIAIDTGCSASVWLMSHEETNRSARIRALLNFLKRRFAEHRGLWFSE